MTSPTLESRMYPRRTWFGQVNAPMTPIDSEFHRRFLTDASRPSEGDKPTAVLLAGAIACGKTTYRREHLTSHVAIDPGDVYNAITQEDKTIPANIGEWYVRVGRALAAEALRERRTIVVEVVPTDDLIRPLERLIDGLKQIGYTTSLVGLDVDPETGVKRNRSRSPQNISAYHTGADAVGWLLEEIARILANDEEAH